MAAADQARALSPWPWLLAWHARLQQMHAIGASWHAAAGVACALLLMTALWCYFSFARAGPPRKGTEPDGPRDIRVPPELLELLPAATQDTAPMEQVSEDCLWANLVLQHAFMACRDTPKMRERFETYLTNKVGELSRRLGCYLAVRSYDMGHAMPYLTHCRVIESVLELPRTSLVVQCEFTYTGALSVDLDVSLPLGVPATVSVKLQGIKGHGRLVLAAANKDADNVIERDAHWWFAFDEAPLIDLRTETTLRGRRMGRIGKLIEAQLRASIRKRHVLPAHRPHYLLKDRLVWTQPRDLAAASRPEKPDLPSFRAELGTLAVRVECLENVLASGRGRDAIFGGQRVYAVLQYSSGLERRKTMAVRPMNRALTWDEILTFTLQRDSGVLDVFVYEKYKLAKDVLVGTGSIALSDIVTQCALRGATHWEGRNVRILPVAIATGDLGNDTGFSDDDVDDDRGPGRQAAGGRRLTRSQTTTHLSMTTPEKDGLRRRVSSNPGSPRPLSQPLPGAGRVPTPLRTSLVAMPTMHLAFRLIRTDDGDDAQGQGPAPAPAGMAKLRPRDATLSSQAAAAAAAAAAMEGIAPHVLADSVLSKPTACAACGKLVGASLASKCLVCGLATHRDEQCAGIVRSHVCPGTMELAPAPDPTEPGQEKETAEADLPAVRSLETLLGPEAPQMVVDQPEAAPANEDDAVVSLIDIVRENLKYATEARGKLCALQSKITSRQQDKISEQVRLQQQFVRRHGRAEDSGIAETHYWFERVQAIQLVLESGEIEKARLAESIVFLDDKIQKLCSELQVLGALLKPSI